MRFLSVCSGIEAASVASAHLGWKAAGFAEIDPFCCSLLKEKYPDVPNYGDFTTIRGDELGPVDAVVGGTPCQDFSVAGKRAGLDGARGNLTLEFVRLVERVSPRWVFWENVPGVLSIDGGRAFGAFLGALGQLGYGWGYRTMDAQYLGVPQERRRVFVLGYRGAWQPAAAVLLEPESVSRCAPPRRSTEEVARALTACGVGTCGADDNQAAAGHLRVVSTLVSNGDAHSGYRDERGLVLDGDRVRRITPREAERLQGFPDDYTLITHRGKPAADGPRYKALGNSWAVPCVRWIFERMDAVDKVLRDAPR